MPSGASDSQLPAHPPAPKPFSFDAAIKQQLANAPPESKFAVVFEAEKHGDENARGQASLLIKSRDGHWIGKGYVRLEEHEKPSYGAQVIFST